jgi:NhaP-type Na+/H+ or K+/H+ antiporter
MPAMVAAVLAADLLRNLLIGLAVFLILGVIAFFLLRHFLQRHARSIAIGTGAVVALLLGGAFALQGGTLRGAGFVLLIVGGFFLWAVTRRNPKAPAGGQGPGA